MSSKSPDQTSRTHSNNIYIQCPIAIDSKAIRDMAQKQFIMDISNKLHNFEKT